MSFMKETYSRALPIWDDCKETSFVRELQKGTLPMEKFEQYIIQDSIYLKHYARIYGKAIYHSTTLKDIQMFYSALCFVTDKESAVRLNYLKQFGLTDDDIESIAPLPENKNYIVYMLDIAEKGNTCEMLMAVLPCMLSYCYIFRSVASDPQTKKSWYCDLIEDYANEDYLENCKIWSGFAEEKCSGLCDCEREELAEIFEKASRLELGFWEMSYRQHGTITY